MKDKVEISLRYEDNNTGHNDVVFLFAGQTSSCDSYYFALDGALMPERQDVHKIRLVLRRLVEQWLTAVENIPEGGAVYLPYDFSDQYTGWLRCARSGNRVNVCQGWSPIEG